MLLFGEGSVLLRFLNKVVFADSMMDFKLTDFSQSETGVFTDSLKTVFHNTAWVGAFLADKGHGFHHGMDVVKICQELIDKLDVNEKELFIAEGREVCPENPFQGATVVVKISAVLHDCGYFDDNGNINPKKMGNHPNIGAVRALEFCNKLSFGENVEKYVHDAVLGRDFKGKEITPHYKQPTTMVGKIVQSADQSLWFHPDGLRRAIDYNQTVGNLIFDHNLSVEERFNWKTDVSSPDAFTVMLHMLFGPKSTDRFGIKAARDVVDGYTITLSSEINKVAEKHGFSEEAKKIMIEFSKLCEK